MLQCQGVDHQDATPQTKAPNTMDSSVEYRSSANVVFSCKVTTTSNFVNEATLKDSTSATRETLIGGCSLQRLGSVDEEPLTESEDCLDTTSDSETSSSGSSIASLTSIYNLSSPGDESEDFPTSSGGVDCGFSGEATRSSATGTADAEDYARASFQPVRGIRRKNTWQTGTKTDEVDRGGCDQEGSSRCLSKVRSLSSQCLERLDWGETARIPEPSSPRETNFVDVSGPSSDQDHPSSLHYRSYSWEASHPPPQVLQGFKLHYVALDQGSWLEVRDEHHRYGKNLRLYFKEWDRQGNPGGSFFDWLSTPEVQLEVCPRHELERHVVHYCRPEERGKYALRLDVTAEGRAMLHTAKGEAVNSGPNAWLFVLRDGTIFATDKKTDPPRFHHSSFFGGGCVEAAGLLVAENGVLVTLYPHSGHYRPTNSHLQRFLRFLKGLGVDLSAIQVDAQRVHKVARPDKRTERRVRKMDNPFMVSGMYLLDYFDTKHKAWASSLFVDVRQKARERDDRLHRASTGINYCDVGGGGGGAGRRRGSGEGAGGGNAAAVYGGGRSGGGSVPVDSGGGIGAYFFGCGDESSSGRRVGRAI